MRSSTYGKLDHSVVEEESSRWHLATTPPEGLSWQEANRRVVTGLCDVVNQYDLNFQQLWVRKKKKLGMAAAAAREGKPFWHLERYSWFAHGMMDRVGFIGTVDGASSAVELLGLLAIFVYETIVYKVINWPSLVTIITTLTVYVVNVILVHRMNQDERHKASEKVKSIISEYLRSFKPETAPNSHLDPPNSSFVSVLRNGEWRRLPASLVVEGDIFKLRPGDVFPVTACPVMLKRVPYPPDKQPEAESAGHTALLFVREHSYGRGSTFAPLLKPDAAAEFAQSMDTEQRPTEELSRALSVSWTGTNETGCWMPSIHAAPSLNFGIFIAKTSGLTLFVKRHLENSVDYHVYLRKSRYWITGTKLRAPLFLISLVFAVIVSVSLILYVSLANYAYDQATTVGGTLVDNSILTLWTYPIHTLLLFLPLIYRVAYVITDTAGHSRLFVLTKKFWRMQNNSTGKSNVARINTSAQSYVDDARVDAAPSKSIWKEFNQFQYPAPTTQQGFQRLEKVHLQYKALDAVQKSEASGLRNRVLEKKRLAVVLEPCDGMLLPIRRMSALSEDDSEDSGSDSSDSSSEELSFREQWSIFRNALGGTYSVDVEDNSFASSNLLHALNSTTYLCFLDKEGLLTTSRRMPSEVCVPYCKSPPDGPLPGGHSRNETDIAILDLQAVDIPKASWLRKEPSEEVEDDAAAFALRSDALNSRRVQLAEGLRFENHVELKKHIVQLRALGVATSRARLASTLPRRQAESSSNSSAFQTMWNFAGQSFQDVITKPPLRHRFLSGLSQSEKGGTTAPPKPTPPPQATNTVDLLSGITHMLPDARSLGWLYTTHIGDLVQSDRAAFGASTDCLCAISGLVGVNVPAVTELVPIRECLVVRSLNRGDYFWQEEGLDAAAMLSLNSARRNPLEPPTSGSSSSSSWYHERDSLFDVKALPAHAKRVESLLSENIGHRSSISSVVSTLTVGESSSSLSSDDAVLQGDDRHLYSAYQMEVLPYSIVNDERDKSMHLFTKGGARLVTSQCGHLFNGTDIQRLDEHTRRKIADLLLQWESSGLDVVAFAHRRIEDSETAVVNSFTQESIFARCDHSLLPLVSYPGDVDSRLSEPVMPSLTPFEAAAVLTSRDGFPFSYFPDWSSFPPSLSPYRLDESLPLESEPSQYQYNCLKVPVSLAAPYDGLSWWQSVQRLPFSTDCERDPPKPVASDSVLREELRDFDQRNHDLIFLGMTALRQDPLKDVHSRIHDLHRAGVRFVYFGRESNTRTAAFGSQLGIDTSWNAVISLKNRPRNHKNLDGNVVMPSGIADIRNHLDNVDDIPIRVSLYSNCTTKTTSEMIRILQENGEVVTVVGSGLRHSNFDVFEEADCAVGILMRSRAGCPNCSGIRRGASQAASSDPHQQLASALTCLPCAIVCDEPPLQDTPQVTALVFLLIKEARRIVEGITNSMFFYAGACCCYLASSVLLFCVLGAPPMFQGLEITMHLLVKVPLISASLLFNPTRSHIMRTLNVKRREGDIDFSASGWATCMFAPCVLALVSWMLTYVILFNKALVRDTVSAIAAAFPNSELLRRTDDLQKSCTHLMWGQWLKCFAAYDRLLGAAAHEDASVLPGWIQNWIRDPNLHSPIRKNTFVLFDIASTYFLLIGSLSFVNGYEPMWRSNPLKNKGLAVVLAGLIILEVAVTLPIVMTMGYSFIDTDARWTFLFMLLGPLTLLLNEGLVKAQKKNQFETKQKYAHLLFETRLGMWSPK